MKRLPRTGTSIIQKPASSGSLLPSLVLSLLLHLSAFAFSCTWTITAEERSQPMLVELIDAPAQREEGYAVRGEVAEPGGVKRTVQAETRSDGEGTAAAHYLPAKADLLQEPSPQSSKTLPPHADREATVALDSEELRYVSYLSTIKKKIEPFWEYPDAAQAVGLQGKLALYFSIVRDGRLDRLELISSSGHTLLDEQALKAIRGAAPYYPLPDRLQISRLNIHATFEYRMSPYTMSTFARPERKEHL